MFKAYVVKVAVLGADSPKTFYFRNEKAAKACYDEYERADDIESFMADDDFPEDMLSDECFLIKNVKIADKLFSKLWKDALAQPDREMYVAEYGYPEWFDEISDDVEKVVEVLNNIHDTAHMKVRDIIAKSGLTQSEFAVKFCIPLRTVEDWATEKRKCKDYDRLMFARLLEILNV